MESSIVLVILIVVSVSYSLPIRRDMETVQSTKSLSEFDVTEKTPVLDIGRVLSLDEEINPVSSFSTETVLEAFTVNFEADHLRRIKRGFIISGKCSNGLIEYCGRCMTQKQYDEITGDDYKES